MATFLEMLQGAGNNMEAGFNSPWTQLGLQMLQNSGQMEGNPSFAQRFGAAGQGFMQQRNAATELEQQKLLRQVQLGQLAAQMQRQQREEQTRLQLQEAVRNDPEILKNSPLARAVLERTGDISGIADIAKIGQPVTPKAPYTYEENLPGGDRQQYIWDPATGGYRATAPYRPTQQQTVDQRDRQFDRTMGFKEGQATTAQSQWEKEQAVREQQAATAAAKADTAAQAELRKAEAAVRSAKIDRVNLQSQYRIADKRFADAEQRIDTLINHPGLKGNYSFYGTLKNIPGTDAANARALLNELRESLSFNELNQLKQMGVNLAPITEAERSAAGTSVANLENAQDYESAVAQLQKAKEVVRRSREEASTLFGQLDSIYGQPAPQQQPQQGGRAPAIGTVEEGYEYVGGDPANPNSWRKR